MSLLLDTHVVLWWLTDDPALCEGLTLATRDPHCQKYEISVLPV